MQIKTWPGDRALALLDAADPSAAWDHAGLDRLVEVRAARLAAQGPVAGHVVAVPESPGLDLILMQHALARAGAALLPLPVGPHGYPGPVGLGQRGLLELISAEWVWVPGTQGEGRLESTGLEPPPAASDAWPSPLALVVQTGGSGAETRAVMHSRASLLASATRATQALGLGPGDLWLCCLPLRHIGGLAIAYRCALAGAGLVLREGFEAARVLDDLARHRVTHLSLVPPMLARLLDLGAAPPPHLRVVLVGGQRLGAPLAERALGAGWPLRLSYGMTETASMVALSGPIGACPRPGEVGPPLPGMEFDCGEPPGSVGLRIRGPVVMAGYANPRRLPGLGLVDGWLQSCDLACLDLDPAGRPALRILGRADEVLVTGGSKVFPAKVESLLLRAPGVRDLAVVGLDDAIWGQRLVAVYCGDASPSALDAWSRERLRGAERPRAFVPVEALPLLPTGKQDRRRVVELAAAGLRRDPSPTGSGHPAGAPAGAIFSKPLAGSGGRR